MKARYDMSQDEFKVLKIKQNLISFPKSIFELPAEEKAQALRDLEEDMKHYQQISSAG